MSPVPYAAMLVASHADAFVLLPRLRRIRPDLAWQWRASMVSAAFMLCSGDYAVAVVDADHAEPGFEGLLRQVYRTSSGTRLLVFAREPEHTRHAFTAACNWLKLVSRDTLEQALGSPP